MKRQNTNRIKLGLFVVSSIVLFFLGLYFVGIKKNNFRSTVTVYAVFNDVNGLVRGNNVRFNGINIGTVSMIDAIADTSVKVEFTLDEKVMQHISKDALVSIGTDGLLGNKVINIRPGHSTELIAEGDVMQTSRMLEMDETFRTLDRTNHNLDVLTGNLTLISEKILRSSTLWNLLSDPDLVNNINSAIVSIKVTGEETAVLSGNLRGISDQIKKGKGSLGALITDTSLYANINHTIIKLNRMSDTAVAISGNLSYLIRDIKNGKGGMGILLADTTFARNLSESMKHINSGTKGFDDNMEALKHSKLLKGYFKKK